MVCSFPLNKYSENMLLENLLVKWKPINQWKSLDRKDWIRIVVFLQEKEVGHLERCCRLFRQNISGVGRTFPLYFERDLLSPIAMMKLQNFIHQRSIRKINEEVLRRCSRELTLNQPTSSISFSGFSSDDDLETEQRLLILPIVLPVLMVAKVVKIIATSLNQKAQ